MSVKKHLIFIAAIVCAVQAPCLLAQSDTTHVRKLDSSIAISALFGAGIVSSASELGFLTPSLDLEIQDGPWARALSLDRHVFAEGGGDIRDGPSSFSSGNLWIRRYFPGNAGRRSFLGGGAGISFATQDRSKFLLSGSGGFEFGTARVIRLEARLNVIPWVMPTALIGLRFRHGL
jgi:hypothetical protein